MVAAVTTRKKMKLTTWFDGAVKPVRPGVYQLKCMLGEDLGYQKWNGKHWSFWYETAERAATCKGYAAGQNDKWRGMCK